MCWSRRRAASARCRWTSEAPRVGQGFQPLLLFIEGAIIGFLIAVPVGPAAILCVRRTISTGIVAGVVTGIGASLGDTLFGAAAAFGLTFVNDFIVRNEGW